MQYYNMEIKKLHDYFLSLAPASFLEAQGLALSEVLEAQGLAFSSVVVLVLAPQGLAQPTTTPKLSMEIAARVPKYLILIQLFLQQLDGSSFIIRKQVPNGFSFFDFL